MEKLRIVRCSSSPWASLLHRVEKKTPDTWSPCGDYRWLNEATVHTTGTLYLIYRISLQNWGARNLLKNWLGTWVQSISGGSCRCTKDCSDNTLQPLQVPTYAIWTQNATQAFQRFMDQVCRGLEEFLFVYIDDTLVTIADAKEHWCHLHLLFQRLAAHGKVVDVTKCTFGIDVIDFLSHQVTAHGVKLLPEWVEAIC